MEGFGDMRYTVKQTSRFKKDVRLILELTRTGIHSDLFKK